MDSADTHLEMWKHYDNLRQNKNSSFLTANTVLAAVVGLSGEDLAGLSADFTAYLIPWIAVVGLVLGLAWLMLLLRNSAYIKHHRELVQEYLGAWRPTGKLHPLPSGVLDAAMPVAFVGFWIFLLAQWIIGLSR